MDNISVMLIKPLDDHPCSVDGSIVNLEDTPPGMKEMLQHVVKMITRYHEVVIDIDLAFQGNDHLNHARKMHPTTLQNYQNPSLLEPQGCGVL